ncbi:hypothetical protein B0H16DRAFT_1513573 [Mycena metata]|uniref:Uncharacterized protein n=1 Tax=Mycena metata TaxID=1033252 RepID=A0AAD7JVT4_9AGAR|nr:hypothetical protein B0H16DRAFT_1513573 [Mycena metata]
MALSDTLLVHRNIEVWLSDNEDGTILHEKPEMRANTLTASVPLAKGTEYAINWRKHPGTAHTVFCEIFIPIKGKDVRLATHFMDKDRPETQTRSSFGRVNSTLIGTKINDWLIAPAPSSSKKAFVELRIRRAQGTPIHECVPDPDDPGGHLDDIDIDLVDDEDEAPFIVFRFNFLPLPKPERNNAESSSKSAVSRKRKYATRRQSPSIRSNARKRQDIGHQEPHKLEDPPRPLSPLSEPRDSPAPREQDQGKSDQLAALRKEEEALDAKLEAQIQATKKRIAEKQKLLEEYSITV